jgi:D-xylose transport system ATP-binding protein
MNDYERTPILQMREISKRFGAIQALFNTDFEVFSGEVVGLVGDNGAGKSTLIKVMAGVYKPDSGKYIFEGNEVSVNSPREARKLGVETVYQDLALCDNLDVIANLYLGREPIRPLMRLLKTIDEIAMEQEALRIIAELRISIPSLHTQVGSLSGGQRQSIALARAAMWNSRVVLLDEPTASLGVTQTQQVKNLVLRLRERGLGLVVISHNLDDVFEITDRIVVLRLGHSVSSLYTHMCTPEQVIAASTGAEFTTPRKGRDLTKGT